MRKKDRTGGWLSTGIILVLLLAVASIVWAAVQLRDRRVDVAELVLERSQQMLHVRLDGMVQQLNNDLLKEAAAISGRDLQDSAYLGERWSAVFFSKNSLIKIELANELGDRIRAVRSGTDLLMTIRASKRDTIPEDVTDALKGAVPEVDTTWAGDPEQDPRAELWFTKALEDTQGVPVWNMIRQGEAIAPRLQLSYLVRSEEMNVPFRILMFEVDLKRSPWVDTRSSPLHHMGVVLHDGDGVTLSMPDAMKEPVIVEAEKLALEHWSGTKSRKPFPITTDAGRFMAFTAPYLLNGETLYGTTLVDMASVTVWTEPERRGILMASGLLAMLMVLLGLYWFREKREAARIRIRDERSESQGLELAKALGEREVLSREVHHRVKNNLQVVSSLLNLQVTRMDDDAVRTEFLRGKRRIDIIALVHHELYGLKDLRNVDLALFFEGLITAIKSMHHPGSERVSVDLNTGNIRVDQDTAIELGIILCELLSNTFQHAFPYATGGHIDIQIQAVEGDLYRMLMKDNGQGLLEGYADGPGKLGLEIVEALAEQLDGAFHTRADNGTVCEVLFRTRYENRLSFLDSR